MSMTRGKTASSGAVTVIVPCRNGAATLAEALESVFAQTVPPLEVLVIDDRSTDDSVAVARSFGPRVRVLRNPGRGPGAARELGVREARGTYIAFVDADDVLEPEKHARQLAVLERSDPSTVVHTGSVIFRTGGGERVRRRVGEEEAVGRCTRVVFERNPVCGASMMLRRSVVLDLGNYDPDLIGTEDFGLSLIASTRCDFVHLPEPLYRIRRHEHNITNRTLHMAYHHWLAQERFRLRCPEAFARLPGPSVRRFMIEPVLRVVKEAYWRREGGAEYRQLLRLAVRLAPDDAEIRRLHRRRWCPMGLLRMRDRWQEQRGVRASEAS